MSSRFTLVLIPLVGLLLLAAWWMLMPRRISPPRATATPGAAAPGAGAAQPASGSPTTSLTGEGTDEDDESRVESTPEIRAGVHGDTLHGRLVDRTGRGVADQPYWIEWGRDALDEKSAAPDDTTEPEGAPRTDDFGRFRVPLQPSGFGILWLRAPNGLRVGVRVNGKTLNERDWADVRLPHTATTVVRGVDLPPNTRFRVWVRPAVRKAGSDFAASDAEIWPSRYWRRIPKHVDFVVHHAFCTPEVDTPQLELQLLDQRPYAFEIQAVDRRVLDPTNGARVGRAPCEVIFRTGPATPSVSVVVRDSAGGPATKMAGAVVSTALRSGKWTSAQKDSLPRRREHDRLVDGRCRVGYGLYEAGQRIGVFVIMSNGEFFERTVTLRGAGRQDPITFVRGDGLPPTIVPIELPKGATPIVFSESRMGPITRGTPWREFDLSNRDFGFGYVVRERGILVVLPPKQHARYHVVLRDGRVLSGRTAAESKPTRPLPVVDLADAYRDHGFGNRATAAFEVRLVSARGRRKWVVAERFEMDHKTKWFPAWRKVATEGFEYRFRLSRDGHEDVLLGK